MKEPQEFVRPLTTKGQVTIPVEVRRLLGVKPRGKVTFLIAEGRVELQPSTMTLEATFGAVTPRQRPEDFAALRDTAVEEHVQGVLEEMGGGDAVR